MLSLYFLALHHTAPCDSPWYCNIWWIILPKKWWIPGKYLWVLSLVNAPYWTATWWLWYRNGKEILGSFVIQGYEVISNPRTQQSAKHVLRVQQSRNGLREREAILTYKWFCVFVCRCTASSVFPVCFAEVYHKQCQNRGVMHYCTRTHTHKHKHARTLSPSKSHDGYSLFLSPNKSVTKPLLFYRCNPSQLTALIFKDTLIHPNVV